MLLLHAYGAHILQFFFAQRNAAKTQEIATAHGWPYIVCDAAGLLKAMSENDACTNIGAVLNCAGPFVETFEHVSAACMAVGAHYTDVTGEVEVFQAAAEKHQEAQQAGVVLMPGVGFDIVATDCVAAQLIKDLPSATHLSLAFTSRGGGGSSKGTATTLVKALSSGAGALVREEGQLNTYPIAEWGQGVDFGDPRTAERGSTGACNKQQDVVLTRWGDAVTAYYTTGIKNVEVFFRLPSPVCHVAWALTSPYGACLRALPIERALTALIVPEDGPSAKQQSEGRMLVWGEARDVSSGKRVRRRLHITAGYAFTALSSILAVEWLMFRLPRRQQGAGARTRKGFMTPGSAFGPGFAEKCDESAIMFQAERSTQTPRPQK